MLRRSTTIRRLYTETASRSNFQFRLLNQTVIYASACCGGALVSNPGETNRCFDWVDTGGS